MPLKEIVAASTLSIRAPIPLKPETDCAAKFTTKHHAGKPHHHTPDLVSQTTITDFVEINVPAKGIHQPGAKLA